MISNHVATWKFKIWDKHGVGPSEEHIRIKRPSLMEKTVHDIWKATLRVCRSWKESTYIHKVGKMHPWEGTKTSHSRYLKLRRTQLQRNTLKPRAHFLGEETGKGRHDTDAQNPKAQKANFFTNQVANHWNKLSDEKLAQTASTLSKFGLTLN